MTQMDIEKGFWYHKPETDFPPKGISSIEDYKQTERLNIFLTEKKQVKIWCENLSKLDNVKFLWISSNVTQELFDSICQMNNLIGLNIERNTIKSIDKINKLKKLKYVRLANFSKIQNINSLGLLSELKVLSLENFKLLSNFKILENLKNLEGLTIEGSMYGTQIIEDIEFLANFKKLKYLMFLNTSIKNKNFDSILNLKELESFYSSLNYPSSEFEKLNSLTNLKNSNVQIINKSYR
jgi:hypothetical protein